MLPTVRHTKYGRIRGMVIGEGGRSSGFYCSLFEVSSYFVIFQVSPASSLSASAKKRVIFAMGKNTSQGTVLNNFT